MFENRRRGRQARNFANVPKILDLRSCYDQIFSDNWRWVPQFTSLFLINRCVKWDFSDFSLSINDTGTAEFKPLCLTPWTVKPRLTDTLLDLLRTVCFQYRHPVNTDNFNIPPSVSVLTGFHSVMRICKTFCLSMELVKSSSQRKKLKR